MKAMHLSHRYMHALYNQLGVLTNLFDYFSFVSEASVEAVFENSFGIPHVIYLVSFGKPIIVKFTYTH